MPLCKMSGLNAFFTTPFTAPKTLTVFIDVYNCFGVLTVFCVDFLTTPFTAPKTLIAFIDVYNRFSVADSLCVDF